MGDRRGDQERVAGIDRPVLADLTDQGVYRIMRVQDTFRTARGARRVEDHPYGIGIQCRESRGIRRSADQVRVAGMRTGLPRFGAAQHDHLRRPVHRGRHALEHRRVVVAAVLVGNENHCRIGVFEDETDIMVAKRRQDRVHHHAGQRRGEIDDGALVPVGQHERHHAAARHARRQGGRQPAGLAVEGGTVQPNTLVYQHRSPRARLGSGAQGIGQRGPHPQPAAVCV